MNNGFEQTAAASCSAGSAGGSPMHPAIDGGARAADESSAAQVRVFFNRPRARWAAWAWRGRPPASMRGAAGRAGVTHRAPGKLAGLTRRAWPARARGAPLGRPDASGGRWQARSLCVSAIV